MQRTIVYLLKQILATGLRIEHKLDALLRSSKELPMVPPMNGQADPITQRPVLYRPVTLEDGSTVAVRTDGNVPTTSGDPQVLPEPGVIR